MSGKILTFDNVQYAINNKPILTDINISVGQDDFMAIIGPNGGGKTTLLKLILGLISPTVGEIKLFGHLPKIGREYVGYLSQHFMKNQTLPIHAIDVVMGGAITNKQLGWFSQKNREKAMTHLRQVQLENIAEIPIQQLSGGQQQRVFLARSLMNDPKLLILDEPTCHVDPHSGLHFYELLRNLNEKMAIIMVTHDLSAVAKAAKTIACLNQTLSNHNSDTLSPEDLNQAYCCHVDLISHGKSHRVLSDHEH